MSDHDFLGMLSPEELQALQSRAISRNFRRGAALLREGEQATRVLVLTEGRAKTVTYTEDGKEVVLGFVGPGVLRELGWIETGRRTISVLDRDALRRFAR